MPFLTPAMMTTHIYGGATTSISQGDSTILQAAVDAALTEVQGYMSRYDYDQIMNNTQALGGWVADPTLLLYTKSIAKWHFILLANPSIDYEDAETRYNQAKAWLKDIQSGKVVPPGWPLAASPIQSTFFHQSSAKKRYNRY